MNLRQLRYYVAVAKLASFSRAAAHLNVAQSALSRQIRMLEEEFGVRLLARTGRGAVATEIGEVLLARATCLLADADQISEMIAAPGRNGGKVELGIPAAFSGTVARQILDLCRIEYPAIAVKLHEALTGDLVELLTAARLDLAILYQTQMTPSGFVFGPIDSCPIALIHSPTLSPFKDIPPTLEQIAELPMALFERPHGSRLGIDLAFAALGLKPNIAFEVSSFVVLRELVQEGNAYTLMPVADVQTEIESGRLSATTLRDNNLYRTLCVARAKIVPCSRAANSIFRLLCEYRINPDANALMSPRPSDRGHQHTSRAFANPLRPA